MENIILSARSAIMILKKDCPNNFYKALSINSYKINQMLQGPVGTGWILKLK